MGSWSLYVAIVVVSVGLYVHLSAPNGSLLWLMASVAVALLSQSVAGTMMPASHAGFVGAFLSVPFAMLASRVKTSHRASSCCWPRSGPWYPGAQLRRRRRGGRRGRRGQHHQPGGDRRGDPLLDRTGHPGRLGGVLHHRQPGCRGRKRWADRGG